MLCRDASMIATSISGGGAIPIKCRSWQCEMCQPDRRRSLIRQGIAGSPVRFMTITRRRDQTLTPEGAADAIASAWRVIVRMIRKEVMKAPAERWNLTRKTRTPAERKKLLWILERDDKAFSTEVAYLCVFEKHESGWPHLHLLVRSRYIDHTWLSEQTSRLLNSPVVGISWIRKGASSARYVAKYVGEEPHRFGTSKRYWKTQNYEKEQPTDALKVFPEGWVWERCNDSIPTIELEWIRCRREPWKVRGGGIAWGWWLPEVEAYIARKRAGGARAAPPPRVTHTSKGHPARSYGP